MSMIDVDVVVVGGGQAGLAAGYYLRRGGHEFVILDDQPAPGGAWPHTWPTLRLFSPAEYAALPGWPMPPWPDGFPPIRHVIEYLTAYEQRYELPIHRPVRVQTVTRDDDGNRLRVATGERVWRARRVISATGTWRQPFWPIYPGARAFAGRQLHTVGYRTAGEFAGKSVTVVGGGNSAAQLVAEISEVSDTTWVTTRPPRFLPDDVDGRVLFEMATRRAMALAAGRPDPGGIADLGDIVMVPEVRAARDRGALTPLPMFDRLTRDGIHWDNTGESRHTDVIVWATGFRPALAHLRPLHLRESDGSIAVLGTQAMKEPALHLLGYGDWTGPGSATLIGVGRTAKSAVAGLEWDI
ncbi:ArsO family NAD(P)H-dependent flavin-containing monooxygenase [Rhodococcus artemisiae]|uniref:ArsO family NAD(P)H-dependent flavin-containing monooxygenase n=1 Tax=Rhodococcus artemisiae TaxID=714159 RepID=A0ABU7LKP4_9NOCA|nr:ArsO family NAD(P)H-dependent flavin-containing monooxygenase [Rhodococcus artemisiae]MEE2061784.1 ArsO family NAD(P)H-dependent flavin-containing monooxygenase [Rhodococcus artemisiae]